MDDDRAYTPSFDADDGWAPFFASGRGFVEERRSSRAPALPDLGSLRVSSFAERECVPRPWLVKDMLPDRTVSLLTGDGGTGKSLLALQLAVAVASGRDWLGTLPECGPVLYLSAEDDVDEVHRRLTDILAFGDVGFSDLIDFHLVPLAGRDAVLAVPAPRSEIITPTLLWQAVAKKVRAVRPRLVVVDNLADVFAGNENSRPQARQFIGMLRALAIECSHASLILSHPSLNGMSTGTGTSGSTGWSNSVRSRLYLERAKSDDGAEPDPDLRILRVMKTNYAAIGTEVRMRWDRGRYKLDGGGLGSFDRMANEQRAERSFIDLLARCRREGREVSHKRSVTYAPTVFAKLPDNGGFGKTAFEAAMNRLFASETIRSETYGPPSRPASRIITGEVQP